MRPFVQALGCALAFVALGCTRGDDAVGRDPTSTKPSPSTTSAATPSEAATLAAPVASVTLPAVDTRCATPDDCGHFYTYLVDEKCCKGTCSPQPASSSHIEKVDRLCQTIGYADERCPSKKCAQPGRLSCVSGHCVSIVP